MAQMIKRYLASLAFTLLVASSCGQPIIMGPSIAMKGQSNTQLERDEAECKLAAEIDEKKNPEKYQKEAGGFLKSGYAFLPSKHFQACMIARGYKTEVDVQFFRVGVGTGIYYYDVNAKREKTEEAVWNDLRECHKVIMETDIKGGEKAGAAGALIIPLGGIILGFIVDKIIKRTFVPCITDREYVVVETKENTDDDGWKETPVASAPPEAAHAPSKVTPASRSQQREKLPRMSPNQKQFEKSLYENGLAHYKSESGHKAWASSKPGHEAMQPSYLNIFGYAYGRSTVQEAVSEALDTCRKNGGNDCKVTNIDGRRSTPTEIREAIDPTPPKKSKQIAEKRDEPKTKTPEGLSMEQRLQKLMELRQKNLITNEEYQKAKEEVLKKLTE